MRWLALVHLIVWLAPRPSEACSCRPPPPPCEAMWEVDAVFAGKVTQLSRAKKGVLEATVKVTEIVRGVMLSSTVTVSTSADGGSCGYEFQQGESYLIYGAGAAGAFETGLCSRTKVLAEAKEDLAYGRAMPKRAKAVVEGEVSLRTEKGLVKQPGVEVTARGTSSAVKADASGAYRLELAPGPYTLDVNVPGLSINVNEPVTVNLRDPAACAIRPIVLEYDGRIRGVITDAAGKPIPKVLLAAYAMKGTWQEWRLYATTDDQGAYELRQVPPGRFVVAVNAKVDGGPNDTQSYPSTYYPGVPTEDKARAVVVPASGAVDKIDFALPSALPVYEVSGVIRKKNGNVASHAWMQIDNETYPVGTAPTVDANGRYTHRDVGGSTLTLRVCVDRSPRPICNEVHKRLDGTMTVDLVEP